MTDPSINAVLDQLMVFAHFQRDRPVEGKIDVRTPKQPERDDHQYCPAPGNECGQTIISECEPGREQIERRENDASHKDQRHERAIASIYATDHFLVMLCPSAEDTANADVNNETHEINQVPLFDSHSHLLTY